MTDESLYFIITSLNNGTLKDAYLRDLGSNVYFGKIWIESPEYERDSMSQVFPSEFYLIKNLEGLYVGIIYVMTGDLHVFTMPEFRNKGFMKSALKNVILSHLFTSMKVIRITIDDEKKTSASARSLASSLGFEYTVSSSYELHLRDEYSNAISGINHSLSREKREEIDKKLVSISIDLLKIHAEVSSYIGDTENMDDLYQISSQVRDLPHLYRFYEEE